MTEPETRVLVGDALRLFRERPDECAHVTFTRTQGALALALLAISAGLLIWRPVPFLLVLNACCILFYVAHSAYKLALTWLALSRRDAEVSVTEEEIASLRDRDLPTYCILIPLYREAKVLGPLVESLSRLDYPREKLDIQLLLEEDDGETVAAVRELQLPPSFRAVIVPDSYPKTKPKACNHALFQSTGELLVIYDAEDRPEPDQLKKAVVAFRKVPERVICLQAKLNYYNQRQNLLTRWFTSEYCVWFDLFLPGLHAIRAPIPLGGTSNHFKLPYLQKLSGWDAFNVTEDCDLGVRLHKRGYATAVIDSTTWEEANSNLWGWIRQRSRWVKGYLQTYLVHMRRPIGLLRDLGVRDWLNFQLTIGGIIFCFIANPIYWAMTIVWFLTRWSVISAMFPSWVFVLGALCLVLGNFVFAYLAVAGCMKRGYYDLVKYAVLTPAYWVLMSIGGWKAALQLLSRPHYWEKTEHGLAAT